MRVLLLLLACERPDDVPNEPVVRAEPLRIPIADQDLLVEVETPYTSTGEPQVVDLDGDGLVDLLLELLGPEGTTQVIVTGPLGPVAVPSGAWVVTDTATTRFQPLEVSGDGHPDLVVTYDANGAVGGVESTWWLIPSPYDGTLVPGPSWVPMPRRWLAGTWDDLDHDGIADLLVNPLTPTDAVQVTWGPYSRWEGPPDVVVVPLCRNGDVYAYPYGGLRPPVFPGDVDGDGTTEVSFPSWGGYDGFDCGDFTLSLPATGTIDPFASPLSRDGLTLDPVEVLGDWTGDGLPDLLAANGHQLLVSPITLTADGLVPAATVDVDPTVWEVVPKRFDLGSDGVPDVVVTVDLRDERSFAVALAVVPVDTLGASPPIDVAWEIDAGDVVDVVVEGGHAIAVVRNGIFLRWIDLGEASSL